MKRQIKLFEFVDLDGQEEPMTVKRPRNRSDSNSSEVPSETTPLTLVDSQYGWEETQDNYDRTVGQQRLNDLAIRISYRA